MLKIFECIFTRETLKERSQKECQRMQAKMEKKLCRQKEEEQFSQHRQMINQAILYQEHRNDELLD